MDDRRFDTLTRAFARGTSRRSAIKGLFGGVVGGVAVATRLSNAGAQSCTPATVGADCPHPDACTTATCPEGTCVYTSVCTDPCNPCNSFTGTCGPKYCELDYACSGGECLPICSPGQIHCGGGVCADECCDAAGCIDPGDPYCTSYACIDGLCTSGLGECCDDSDCTDFPDGRPVGRCGIDGHCFYLECWETVGCPGECMGCDLGECYSLCDEGQECCGDECVATGACCKGAGDSCGLFDVSGSTEGSTQLDCCDGLVCCDFPDSKGRVCAECCNDWDCAEGGSCHDGWCEYPHSCNDDSECPDRTCCCNDGSCSWNCCDHHHPQPDPTPPAPITTLPATGVKESQDTDGVLGAAALGAAAALYAAKKMRGTPEAQTEE